MGQKAYVRPGKMGSVIGIIGGCVLLVFGVVFIGSLQDDGSGMGQIFMVFWALILFVVIGYYAYNLMSKNASSVALGEIEMDQAESSGNAEEKLRSLERMKKERLITEEEYLQKRREIMQQKW